MSEGVGGRGSRMRTYGEPRGSSTHTPEPRSKFRLFLRPVKAGPHERHLLTSMLLFNEADDD